MRILSVDIGIKNFAIVILDIEKVENEVKIINIDCDLIDLSGNKKCRSCQLSKLIDNIFNALNEIDMKNIKIGLVENQPAFTNPTCKSLCIATYSYLKLKGLETFLVSPTRKLGKEGKKLSYNQKKNQSVIECFKLLNNEQKEKVNNLNRAHDCTDAILQAYTWFKNQ